MREKKNYKRVLVEESVQLVTFRVGAEEYGLDIGAITEVIRPLKITPLPKMPPFVEGVVNLRGIIIPVVDLRKRFDLKTINNDTRRMRMVITRGATPGAGLDSQGLLGLVVDAVEEVVHVPRNNVAPAPSAATSRNADFITGMGKLGERLIILLDIGRILSLQERTALAEAGRGEDENVRA